MSNDSLNAVTPAIKTIADTITDVKYSTLPCPNGCSLSGALFAIFVPTIVITEDITSVKLFTASNTIAIEFVIIPITALNATRSIFTNIPSALVLIIFFSLSNFFTFIF